MDSYYHSVSSKFDCQGRGGDVQLNAMYFDDKDPKTYPRVRLYLSRQASSLWRYLIEQSLYLLIGWVPTLIGIGIRGNA